MSRSRNHCYYTVCENVGKDGYCDWHREYPSGVNDRHGCIPERVWMSRRGLVVREKRFKDTWKCWCSGPPVSIKRLWQRKIRAMCRQEMRHRPYDPELTDSQKLLAGWYGWWA
jgi:hypothetical protein